LCSADAGATLRQADPAFAPGGPLASGAAPCSIAASDFNGDARPDLAVGNCRTGTLAILLGDGGGRFHAGTGSPFATSAPRSAVLVVAADVNADRRTDVVVANAVSSDASERGKIAVYIGDGAGGLQRASPAITPVIGILDIAATDVTSDGRTDLVMATYRDRRNSLTVLRGDGGGGFAPVAASPIPVRGTHGWPSVAVADLNGDGRPDAAGGDSEGKLISILLGDGAGGFREASTATVGAGPRAIVAADLNGDGRLDLATSSAYGLSLTILLGDGAGGFRKAPGSPFAVPSGAASLAAADVNRDGRPDIAATGDALTVLLGIGAGRFRPAAYSPFAARSSGTLVVGDFDGDGRSDLALPGGIMFQTPSTPPIAGSRVPAGPRDRVFAVAGVPFDLAADEGRVAIATADKKRCEPVIVWNALRATSQRFKPGYLGCFGDGVGSVAVGDGQVAWIEGGGGNSEELAVMAARLRSGRPKQIAYAVNGNRAGGDPVGGYVGDLQGGGSLLAFNEWHVVCSHRDPQYDYCDGWTDVAKRIVRVSGGSRAVVVKRGPEAYPLSAVGGGRMTIESDGAIAILARNGSQLARVPRVNGNPPRAMALSRTRLAVLRTFTLDLYNPTTGRKSKSLPLGSAAGLELTGVNSRFALFGGSGRQTLFHGLYLYVPSYQRLVLARLADGKLVSLPVRATRRPIDPTLTEAGLFYAYIDQRAPAKRRIVFEPTARLLSRF
jgi:hypothetical protein